MRIVSFDPRLPNNLAHLAWAKIEYLESTGLEIAALSAWSDGSIWIWTEEDLPEGGTFYAFAVGAYRGTIVQSDGVRQKLIRGHGRYVHQKFHTIQEARRWISRTLSKEDEIPNTRTIIIDEICPKEQLKRLISILEHSNQPLNIVFSQSDYCVNVFNYYESQNGKHPDLWDRIWHLTQNRRICLKFQSEK